MPIRASRSGRVSSQFSNGYTAVAQTPVGAPQMCDDVRALFILTHTFDILWCVCLVSAGILFHLAACSTSSPIGNLVDGSPLVANTGAGMIGQRVARDKSLPRHPVLVFKLWIPLVHRRETLHASLYSYELEFVPIGVSVTIFLAEIE